MNTFSKFAPNVWLAKCAEKHKKGAETTLSTKYGKDVEIEIHNFIYEKDGFFFYSFVRLDGINSQERAKRRAERLQGFQDNAMKRASDWRGKANEGADFLALGEPIKIGHHSEKRHRALIERNDRRMQNWNRESKKADTYDDRIEYWESQAKKVDLSMPESLEYFEAKLEKAKETHKFYKENPDKREHSYSLTYANKEVKEMQKKYDLAVRLWA